MTLNADHAVRLEHGSEVERQAADLDAMDRELVHGALIQLRGLEQRLRGDASGVQAGSAERKAAVAVLPFIDAGDFELVLGGMNRGGIARGPAADHDDVIEVVHTPSTMRAGSSRHCLTVTRNCTASRPSMMR